MEYSVQGDDTSADSTKGVKFNIQDENPSLVANGIHYPFSNFIYSGVRFIDVKSSTTSPSRDDSVASQSMEKKPIRFFTAGI